MEEIATYLKETVKDMEQVLDRVGRELAKIRTGKASPDLLIDVKVSYYGTMTPLSQVASITTPDSRSIFVKPWEKKMIPEVEKAILMANLGVTPQNDGQQIVINIPILTEERRKELMKQVARECERGKINIRGVRKEVNDKIGKEPGISEDNVNSAQQEVQRITDDFVKKIDELFKRKESRIMTI